MNIKLLPEHERVILSMAAKIRGSRGGKTVTPKKLKALRRVAKLNTKKAA